MGFQNQKTNSKIKTENTSDNKINILSVHTIHELDVWVKTQYKTRIQNGQKYKVKQEEQNSENTSLHDQ